MNPDQTRHTPAIWADSTSLAAEKSASSAHKRWSAAHAETRATCGDGMSLAGRVSERASRGDLIHHRSCEKSQPRLAYATTEVTQPVLTGYLRTLAAAGRGRPPGVTTFDDLTGWLPSLE